MDRRNFLGVVGGSLVGISAGCTQDRVGGSNSPTTTDPFPDSVEGAERGGADEPLIVTIQEREGYEDGSIKCARKAHEPFHAHLPEETTVSHLVSTGYGNGPEGYDGMAIRVTLVTTVYDRDGEVMETADIEYSSLVNASPPTVILQSDSGESVCAVPVYVSKGERHID